ncbi:MAG: class I SAM-dependent methyltransferase [Proteobacteria bacterium]|nr:class I SAM-dependent methyltransferase [Pseudomonadota bacterium]
MERSLKLKLNLQLNAEEERERQLYNLVPTLNGMGYMYERYSPFVNEYLKAYIESLPHIKDSVLDIGVAYGVTVLDSLKMGARVVANEIYKPHLDLLVQNVPTELKNHLSLNLGRFPQETNFEENSFGAVLISRVLNFLTGDEIDRGMAKVFQWLKPGAKVYIIAETVYKELFKKIIPIVQERITQNHVWPGELDHVRSHMSKRQNHLPEAIHFLDDKILKRSLLKAGFSIEKCSLFSKNNIPQDARFDGKETVGIIGVKPA